MGKFLLETVIPVKTLLNLFFMNVLILSFFSLTHLSSPPFFRMLAFRELERTNSNEIFELLVPENHEHWHRFYLCQLLFKSVNILILSYILSSCIQFTILSCLDYSKPAHSWYHFNIHTSDSLYAYNLLKLQSKYNSLLSLINTYHTRPDSIYFYILSPVPLPL